jgi:hypothetical protein
MCNYCPLNGTAYAALMKVYVYIVNSVTLNYRVMDAPDVEKTPLQKSKMFFLRNF